MQNKFKGFDSYKLCKDDLLSFNYSRLLFHKSGKNSVISVNQFWGTFVDTFVFSWADISVIEIHDTLSEAFFCGFVVNFQKLSELMTEFKHFQVLNKIMFSKLTFLIASSFSIAFWKAIFIDYSLCCIGIWFSSTKIQINIAIFTNFYSFSFEFRHFCLFTKT